MKVRTCEECGRLLGEGVSELCPQCYDSLDADFDRIRSFLDQNPGLSCNEIAEALDIKVRRVLRLLRSGRLEGLKVTGLSCARCQQPIAAGVLCPACADTVRRELSSLDSPLRIHHTPGWGAGAWGR